VVEEATLMLAEQAHVKGLKLAHWVDSEVPFTVTGDRARLRQILLNLLSNAVKFTASGEVTLRVVSRDADELYFSVFDTGIGIDQQQARTLFDAFVQADRSTTRQYGGTGLGLAISRRLVELMNGRIGAEPRESGGSVFWFSAVMPAASASAQAARARVDLQGRRIIVVDDNATNRTILEHYLRSWGVACESVDRPSAAIDALERASRDGQPFELAALDFNMPETDGIELIREIRRRPGLGALRIVMLSSGSYDHSDFEGLGVSATLTKPAGQAAIYDAITDALAGSSRREPTERPTSASSPGRGLTVLLAEDNEINSTLAKIHLDRLGLRTEIARDGREAIDMAAAHDYAAIFMDCQMPILDGFEATRRIRAAENGRRVPIIAMTALAMPADRDRCLAAGMDDYLSKPIRRELLETIVERCLRSRESRAQAQSPMPSEITPQL
jgi:CheY-like chemotaxis protein